MLDVEKQQLPYSFTLNGSQSIIEDAGGFQCLRTGDKG
jgi:hypothetical protein